MPASKARSVRLCRVIDGDTVDVRPAGWRSLFVKPTRIRMYGIDAPESDQKGGSQATRQLRRIIGSGRGLRLEVCDTDHYGRTVGLLYHKRQGRLNSCNRQMLAAGHAYWYRQYGGGDLGFADAEAEARRKRRGVWKSRRPQTKPWDYRRRQRAGQAAAGRRRRWLLAILILAAGLAILGYAAVSRGLPNLSQLPFP